VNFFIDVFFLMIAAVLVGFGRKAFTPEGIQLRHNEKPITGTRAKVIGTLFIVLGLAFGLALIMLAVHF
jgi:hypothetical protein